MMPARSSVTGTGPARSRSPVCLARHEVLGIGVARHEPAEIDDALDTGSGRCAREVVGGLEIEAAEILACRHRVDEVVGDVDIPERCGERFGLQRVGFDEFDILPRLRREHLAVAGSGTHAPAAAGDEHGHEVGSDVSARTEHQVATLRGLQRGGHQRSFCRATSRPGAGQTPRSSARLPSNTTQLCAP